MDQPELKNIPETGAAQALEETADRGWLLFEALPVAAVLYDPQGVVLAVNRAFVDTYGWSRQEWLGKRIDFVPAWEEKKTQAIIARTLAGEIVEFETQRYNKRGDLLEVALRTAPYKDPQRGLTSIYVIHRDITQQKRDQAELKESERRYRQLLDASPDPITVYDQLGKVVYVNPAFEQTFGWTQEDLAGKGIDFVPPHEMERTHEAVMRTLRGEKVFLESQRLTKDGRLLDIQLKTATFTHPDGGLAGDIVIYRDITEQKRAAQDLRASQERHRLLLDASPDPITVYDERGKVVYVNPAFEQTFGWTQEDLAGKGIDFVPPHEMERTRQAVMRTLQGENVLLESQRLTKDRRLLDIQLKTAIFTHPDGGLAGDIVIYRDISQRKQVEEELRRHRDHLEDLVAERTAELRQAEARYRLLYEETARNEALYRSLLNSSPDAIIVYDMQGRVRFLNPAFTQVFGWTQEELASRQLEFVPPSELEATWERVLGVVRDGRQHRDFQTKRLTKDGRLLEVEISASRYDDHLGQPAGMVVIIRDITERIRADQERQRLEEQLRQAQKMEAVGVLASGIAHDFNNILQVVGGYLQMMLAGHGSPADQVERMKDMDRLLARGADLVRGLLSFGRTVKPQTVPVDLNQVIGRIVAMLERTIPKMIRIQTELADDLRPVDGDANQLEQLLVNLASNARDAMPQGGRLLIKTANRDQSDLAVPPPPELPPGDYVSLIVSDSGQGMDQETLEHVFEPFFTTKGVGVGAGLGLYRAYGIAKNHGGSIVCQSAPGQGACFTIFLPALPADQGEHPRGPKTRPPSPRGQETILLVDDETAIVEVGREMLADLGYQVITAASGEEALKLFAGSRPPVDLVIMDLGMPGMGGSQALDAMLELNPRAKIIITSGYAGEEQQDQSLRQGAAGFLAKPYRLRDLALMVREVLDQG